MPEGGTALTSAATLSTLADAISSAFIICMPAAAVASITSVLSSKAAFSSLPAGMQLLGILLTQLTTVFDNAFGFGTLAAH